MRTSHHSVSLPLVALLLSVCITVPVHAAENYRRIETFTRRVLASTQLGNAAKFRALRRAFEALEPSDQKKLLQSLQKRIPNFSPEMYGVKPTLTVQRPGAVQSSSSSARKAMAKAGTVEQQVIDLVNKVRKENDLSPLTHNAELAAAALKHAKDMDARDYFAHNTPEGITPTQQIKAAGYLLTGTWATGQNIAHNQKTPEEVMKDWMNSPGHRANILSPNFKEIGIGIFGAYWVQDFGAHQ